MSSSGVTVSKSRLVAALSCVAALVAIQAAPARASFATVSCQPLQTSIDNAAAGDTLDIAQTYTGCSVVNNGKPLTFRGVTPTAGFDTTDGHAAISVTGAGVTTIRDLTFRNFTGPAAGPAVSFFNNTTARVIHSKFFNDRNPTGDGGALEIVLNPGAGAPVIEDSTFGSTAPGQGNSAADGGAVYISTSGTPVTLARNTFAGNAASQTGAGLVVNANGTSPVTLIDNVFTRNGAVSGGGGAALTVGGPLTLTRNRFVQNASVDTTVTNQRRMGGGLSAIAPGGISQADNLFTGNVLSYHMSIALPDSGGGGEWTQGNVLSRRDRFVGNSSTNTNASGPETGGGGLYAFGCGSSAPTVSLQDFVAAGNHVGSPGDGSGVYDGCATQPVALQVLDSTIAANTGGGQIDGGAADTLQVKNSIIAPALGTPAINGFLSRAISFSDTCRAAGPPSPGGGNICADPLLKNSAGGDVHQTSKSPTRDRGSNALIPAGLTTDFEGGPRITDAQPDGTAIVDMGADEAPTGALRLSRLRSSVRTVRLKGRHRRATKFAVTITGPARITYAFTRLLSHHRTRRAGSLASNVSRAGRPTIRFSGRIGRHVLAPGNYRLTVSAKNKLNNRSNRATLTFRVRLR